jgi:dCMP deaminase
MNPLQFVPIAQEMSLLSKDRRTKVAAIVLDSDNNILATGVNGFPRGIAPEKYFWSSHAEENAIAQAARVGARLLGGTMIVSSLYPCSACTRMIIQAGIKVVIVPDIQEHWSGKWLEEMKRSSVMFAEAGVQVIAHKEKK